MKKAFIKESIRNCADQQEEFRQQLSKAHEDFISVFRSVRLLRNYRIRIASNRVAYWEYNLQRNKNQMKFLVNALNSNR